MNQFLLNSSANDAALRKTAESLLDGRSEVTVCAAMSPQQPTFLLAALIREARRLGIAIRLLVADIDGTFDFLDDDGRIDLASGRLQISMLAGGVPRALSGLVDSWPHSLWDADRMLGSGRIACDIYAVRVQPGLVDGVFDLGNMVAYTPTLAARPDVALALEVSHSQQYATGFATLDADAAARAIAWHDTVTPHEAAPPVPLRHDAEREHMARLIASIVPPNATVQVGIGGVAEAIIGALSSNGRRGIHTGMLPNSLRTELAAGRFTGAAKTVDEGLAVATGLSPTAGPDAWPKTVELRPISQTHSPVELARHQNLWSINSAFSVDLGGGANAEWLNGQKLACGGGQADFMRAAHLSAHGASVIALPSRSAKGHSRIVDALDGAAVTTAGGDVDYVVTEYGIAHLTGRTLFERRELLAQIAHPDDRVRLRT
ncbi:acetyl-CoA hydrolase/transferase C-terminal domain-containing protein [Subtercola endophyticus]|uniref:acetyl-CoA hydrolase/transferase C-terminal domain-containing protein n=1 Tax=Subtercola endophyticus TaxID=2895559 RepID=UPI001E493BD3|nr:acetyl-CoA hydrolase/transferase C-terminal domain-containing protein [Subtercola endophyticus]UFS58097.1 hypothetical protein LQ955_13875 [Subtercola endophyticus]